MSCMGKIRLSIKLNTYGLETSALRLIFDYLTNRKEQAKTDCYHSWKRRSKD